MTKLSAPPAPLTPKALRLLAAEAKANGLTVEQQFIRTLEDGYGVSAAHVMERVLEDARNATADAAALADAEAKPAAAETKRAA